MDVLSKCILLLMNGVELYIFLSFVGGFFECRQWFLERRYRIVIVCGIALVMHYGINLLESTVLNIVWTPISFLAMTCILFEGSYISKLLYVIVSYMIIMLCEFIYAVITGDFRNGSTKQASPGQVSAWQLISMEFLKYIIFFVIRQFASKKGRKLDKKWVGIYVLILISNLMFMLIIIYSGIDFFGKLYAQIAVTVCFGGSVAGNIFLFYLFHKYSETIYSEAQNELYIQRQNASIRHYQVLEEANNRYAEFQHDISHYLQAIGELAVSGENEKIAGILQELHVQMNNNVRLVYSKHPVLNAMLSEKVGQCEKKHITAAINVEPLLDAERLTDAEWIAILGNLLDNAVRAAGNCTEGRIDVNIFMQNDNEYLVIKIGNTYAGQILREDKHLLSTKRDAGEHGIGIRSVRKIVEKCEGMMNQTEENQYFEVTILIPRR